MRDRLPSGNARLDAILGGGVPRNATTLVAGLPGSGKTVLTQQYVFANATRERPAVYFSTVFEPFDKLLRYTQGFEFFDAAAVGESVFFEDLGHPVVEKGAAAALEQVERTIKEHRPGLLVIDSFKALQAMNGARDGGSDTRLAWELAARLSAYPASTFWVGGYDLPQLEGAPAFAVADAILYLSTERTAERETRMLQVLKLRGSGYLGGKHAFRISSAGIDAFPRLADVGETRAYELDPAKTTTGVETLDALLGGGILPGSATLVAGPAGVGKTLLGLHFAFGGARRGEQGVIATLQENPDQLARTAAAFGWSLDEDGIELMYRSPVDLHVDEWVYGLLETVERTGARRVVIDSLTDLQTGAPDPQRFREYLYSLVQRCSRSGVTLLMTSELSDLYRVTRLSDQGVSHFCDNVVTLHYERDGAEIERVLAVLKTRASTHDGRVHAYRITQAGLVVDGDGRP